MIKRYIAVLGLAALCSIGSSYANEAPISTSAGAGLFAGNDCAFNFFHSVPFDLSVTVTRKPGAEGMTTRSIKVRRLSPAMLATFDKTCNSGVEEESTTNPNFKPLYLT